MKKKILSRIAAGVMAAALTLSAVPEMPLSLFGSNAIVAEAASVSKPEGIKVRINNLRGLFTTKDRGNYYLTTNGKESGSSQLQAVMQNNKDLKKNNADFSGAPDVKLCAAFATYAYRYIYGEWPAKGSGFGNTLTTNRKKMLSATLNLKGKSVKQIADMFDKYVMYGDILCYHYPNINTPDIREKYGMGYINNDMHHFSLYTGLNSAKTGFSFFDGNGSVANGINFKGFKYFSGITSGKYGIDKIYVMHAPNYNKIADLVPVIKTVKLSNITNKTAFLTTGLNFTNKVSAWGYFMSTNKSVVANVNGTSTKTQKSTANMDYYRYATPNKNEVTHTGTFSKYQGKPLTPGTTYYIKIICKIDGKWYQSAVTSFTTKSVLPSKATLKVSKGSDNIGLGDQATLLWDAANLADSYNISVTGPVSFSKTGIKASPVVLDGFTKVGEYTATITSVNGAGTTVGSSVTINVLPNQQVTYYDTVAETVIDTLDIAHGKTADAPKPPVLEGHTFSKWVLNEEKSVTEPNDGEPQKLWYDAVYDKNSFTVKFVDSFTNEILKTQEVKYEEAAQAPSVTVPKGYEGYAFAGWDADFDSVTSDITVNTVYKWADSDHSATAVIKDVTWNTKGYDITVTLSNKIDEVYSGRLVAVLKSENGTILTSAESLAFAIDANETRDIKMTVIYQDLAAKVEVYAVNGYDTLGKLTKTAYADIDNTVSDEWSEWFDYQEGEELKTSGNGYEYENSTRTENEPEKKYYRYKLKETTTSTATSLAGYTRENGYDTQEVSSGTMYYAPSWPSGFYTGSKLYKKYNLTPKKASETDTTITKITKNALNGYLYWHWCRGAELSAPINRSISYSKTSTFSEFCAFPTTDLSNKPLASDGSAYKWANASACKDSYWWGRVPIYVQKWTVSNKVYTYTKTSDYSDWIEYTGDVPVADKQSNGAGAEYVNVETKVEPGKSKTINIYRYRIVNVPVLAEPEVPAERKVNISGSVDSQFSGQDVTVWVYKYGQASNFTTEFVQTTKVGEDGSVVIDNAALREAPTAETGDFTITASIDGQSRSVDLGVIEAPKRSYTVNFYDFSADMNKDPEIIKTQTVLEGENAEFPDRSALNVPAGQRFTNWSESPINVRNDMNIYPESVKETYTVAFVNWEKQTVSLSKFEYGDKLIADGVPEGPEGFITEWVVQTGEDQYITLDEYAENGGIVDRDMVVVTRSTPEKFNVTVINANTEVNISEKFTDSDFEQISLNNEEYAESEMQEVRALASYTVENGSNIDFYDAQEAVEESEDIIFLGWVNAFTGEPVEETEVKESMILYPTYVFPETTSEPEISLEDGEYTTAQTVTLTCANEDAVIWYTTDGTDPKTSETAAEYTAPVTLSSSCQLRAYAVCAGCNDSAEVNALYAINTPGKPKYHIVQLDLSAANLEDIYFGTTAWLVKEGSKLSKIEVPEFNGQVFRAFYFDENYTEEFILDAEVIGESMTLYVAYDTQEYNVNFVYEDENGSEVLIDSQKVMYNNAATAPAAPELSGKVFTGWDGDFSTITENTTIKAKYISESEYATVSIGRSRAVTISVGSSFDITGNRIAVTVTPEDYSSYDKVWSSDNEDVAAVDEDGVITGVSAGSTVIRVTLPYTGAYAELKVNVTNDLDSTLVLKATAAAGFDSERNLRNVKAGANTAAEIKAMFENEGLVILDTAGNEVSDTAKVGTNFTVCLYNGDELADSVKVAVIGDFNGDGLVNNKDTGLLNQLSVQKREADKIQMIAMDINGDGSVNNRDCAALLRYIAGKQTI